MVGPIGHERSASFNGRLAPVGCLNLAETMGKALLDEVSRMIGFIARLV